MQGRLPSRMPFKKAINKQIEPHTILSSMYVRSCDCSLCRSQWPHVSAYRRRYEDGFSFKKLYLQLDEATLTFNADPVLVRVVLLLDVAQSHYQERTQEYSFL